MKSSELIQRYSLGICSEGEVEELERRLRADTMLQDAFLREAEIDAFLRQESQSVANTFVTAGQGLSQSHTALWKWVSGISTLAAAVLVVIILIGMPPQSTTLAFPSLGDVKLAIPYVGPNIWAASAEGDLNEIRGQLKCQVSVDAKLECGLTSLHIATLANQPAAVELLLANGADVSLADPEGNTALHMASFLGRTNIVLVLLQGGADPDLRNHLGFSSLDNVAITWSDGLEDYYHHVETVLNTTLDLEQIRAERPKILRLLASEGPILPGLAPPVSLWQAAMTGNTAAVQQHIRAGTNINTKEDFGGSTPLILAAIFGQTEVAKILIDAGAELDAQNNSGGTVLHQACFFGRPEIVRLLVNAGADPHAVNNRGLTPLDVVSIEFDDALEETYRHVFDSLGLKFDDQFVNRSRLQIAAILRESQSENVKLESK